MAVSDWQETSLTYESSNGTIPSFELNASDIDLQFSWSNFPTGDSAVDVTLQARLADSDGSAGTYENVLSGSFTVTGSEGSGRHVSGDDIVDATSFPVSILDNTSIAASHFDVPSDKSSETTPVDFRVVFTYDGESITRRTTCSVTVNETMPESAVSRWEFEQDVTDSWGSNPGTNNGGTFTTTSKVGEYALSVDGSSYVDVGTLPLSGGMSVSTWIRPDDVSNPSFAVNNYGGGNGEQHFILGIGPGGNTNTDQPAFFIDDGSSTANPNASAVTTGTYYHLVGVFDDSADEARLYVDGDLKATVSYSATPNFQERSTWIGRARNEGGNDLIGLLDDPRAYNKPLTDTEVSNLFSTGSITG